MFRTKSDQAIYCNYQKPIMIFSSVGEDFEEVEDDADIDDIDQQEV